MEGVRAIYAGWGGDGRAIARRLGLLRPTLFHAPTPARSRGREPKRPHEARLQPAREYRANKSKENQINPRKKAWISLDSFGRFGTFQCFTGNRNKKISRALNSRLRLCEKRVQRHSLFLLTRRRHARRCLDPAAGKGYSIDSGLWKEIAHQKSGWSRRIDFDTRLPSSGYFRCRRTKEIAEARWTEFELHQSHSEQPTSSAF